MIDMQKIAHGLVQVLRHEPLQDINVVVRDKEIVVQARPFGTSDMVRFNMLEVTLTLK